MSNLQIVGYPSETEFAVVVEVLRDEYDFGSPLQTMFWKTTTIPEIGQTYHGHAYQRRVGLDIKYFFVHVPEHEDTPQS